MSETALILLIIPAFLVAFTLLWSAVVLLVSRMSGWSRMAHRYPAREPPRGETFRWCSARFWVLGNYKNCLIVTVSGMGIHMQPVVFFRIGHRPLFIPWTAVTAFGRRKVLVFPAARLSLEENDAGGPGAVTFYGQRLVQALETAFRKGVQ